LCVQIVVASQAVILAGMYLATGQPHFQRRFAIIRAVVILGLMYPAVVRFGPLGAVTVILMSNFAVLVMQVFKARKVVDLELSRYAWSYVPGLLLALSILVTFGIFRLLRVDSPVLVLGFGGIVLVVTFVAGLLIWNRRK
jgi:hypothetical protein